MKTYCSYITTALVAVFLSLFILSTPVHIFAQTLALPTPDFSNDQATTSASSATLSPKDNADTVIATIKNILTSMDSLAGGFIFQTPDLFSEPITLKDGGLINGLLSYRTLFYHISIPLYVILTVIYGMLGMTSGNLNFLRSYIIRNIVVIFLYIALIPIFAYSIQFNNALTNSIMDVTAKIVATPNQTSPTLTAFSQDYFTQGQSQIDSGKSTPEDIGIPDVNGFSFFQSVSNALLKELFYTISTFALFLGLLFIIFQFTFRFVSLVFLSVIIPVVIPFALLEKTENLVRSSIKIWFTFLIHQPAFALGYGIVVLIVGNVLKNNGASFGLLLMYITLLFFLGTVNVFVARIFGDAWVAIGANVEAKFASAFVGGFVERQFSNASSFLNDAKNGFLSEKSGNPVTGMGSYVGRSVYKNYEKKQEESFTKSSGNGTSGQQSTEKESDISGSEVRSTPKKDSKAKKPVLKPFTYSNTFAKNGFSTQVVDKENGLVSMQGGGYSYYDQKHDLTYTYPTKEQALATGLKENQIKPTVIEKGKYIDTSAFSFPEHPSPHNTWATREAKKQNKGKDFNAHVDDRGSSDRIQNFLSLAEKRNHKLGINGIVVTHFDNLTGKHSAKYPTTKIVTKGKLT